MNNSNGKIILQGKTYFKFDCALASQTPQKGRMMLDEEKFALEVEFMVIPIV